MASLYQRVLTPLFSLALSRVGYPIRLFRVKEHGAMEPRSSAGGPSLSESEAQLIRGFLPVSPEGAKAPGKPRNVIKYQITK
jgi:hypothetical protein